MDAALLRRARLGPIRAAFAMLFLTCLGAGNAHAAAIGAVPQPEGLRFGVMAGLSRADVDDPEGPTDTKNYSRWAALATLPSATNRRWMGELFYHRFDTEPSTDTIGNDVTRWGAALSYQARFRNLPLKPWLGAGASVSRDEFDERVTVDALGFVDQRYPARSDTALGLVLSATAAWKWTNTLDVGLQLQYEQPITGNIKTWTFGLLLMF